jgi:hypothetical protein
MQQVHRREQNMQIWESYEVSKWSLSERVNRRASPSVTQLILPRYVEMLMQREEFLSAGLSVLYRQLKACGGWKGPLALEFDDGEPFIHSLLQKIGVLDGYNVKEEDLVATSSKPVFEGDEVEFEDSTDEKVLSLLEPGRKLPVMQALYSSNDCDEYAFSQHQPPPNLAGDKSRSVPYLQPINTSAIASDEWDHFHPLFLQLPTPEIEKGYRLDFFDLEQD